MDNDVYGHVNNVAYYSYFDTAVNGLLIGAGLLDIEHSKIVGWVVETQCRYLRPVAFAQTLQVGVRVAHLGTCGVRNELAIFADAEPVACAEGYFVHVYVDRASRRPAVLAPTLRAFLESLKMP